MYVGVKTWDKIYVWKYLSGTFMKLCQAQSNGNVSTSWNRPKRKAINNSSLTSSILFLST